MLKHCRPLTFVPTLPTKTKHQIPHFPIGFNKCRQVSKQNTSFKEKLGFCNYFQIMKLVKMGQTNLTLHYATEKFQNVYITNVNNFLGIWTTLSWDFNLWVISEHVLFSLPSDPQSRGGTWLPCLPPLLNGLQKWPIKFCRPPSPPTRDLNQNWKTLNEFL